MHFSQRAQAISPFLAMEFGKHAAALEAAGHHIIKLNIGEPDFGAPPAVLAELQRVVQHEALPFLRAMFMGIFGMLMFFMLSGAFRAAGDPHTPVAGSACVTSHPNSASAYPAGTGAPAWRDHSSAVPKESTQWPACQASAAGSWCAARC